VFGVCSWGGGGADELKVMQKVEGDWALEDAENDLRDPKLKGCNQKAADREFWALF
jgi:hypothetical protein